MPKRSKEDTQATINLILDTATKQLLESGYEAMSYTTLSKETGISRTGISHHFSKKTDFLEALQARLIKQFAEQLDFKNSLTDFNDSWVTGLERKRFRAILTLILSQIGKGEKEQQFSRGFLSQITQTSTTIFGDDAQKSLDTLVGMSFIALI
ncbi:TetR/AcrR family transcriptional regulator [Vibrio intestinalis]|uniref:TetR/AcrR family transcriptional regulator n=1 Tax=Vibrio intestinalis TaxID=2933291 RepID=UPI0021A74CD5|nr:TetR/AcrR family transcriptional regulator [Vibrio intestinalis]